MQLKTRHYLIIVLGLSTAALHFGAALDRRIFPEGPDILFTLNGLGYLGLLAAYFLPLKFLRSLKGLIRQILLLYTMATILAWFVIYVGFFVVRDGHPFFGVDAVYGLPAKIIELGMLYFVRQDRS